MIRDGEKPYFNKLSPNSIKTGHTFWKAIKPSFTEKLKSNQNITLIIDNTIINDKHLNQYFSNVTTNLNITNDLAYLSNADHINDPVLKAIHKYIASTRYD